MCLSPVVSPGQTLQAYIAVSLSPITDAWMDPLDKLLRLPFGSPMLLVVTDPRFG